MPLPRRPTPPPPTEQPLAAHAPPRQAIEPGRVPRSRAVIGGARSSARPQSPYWLPHSCVPAPQRRPRPERSNWLTGRGGAVGGPSGERRTAGRPGGREADSPARWGPGPGGVAPGAPHPGTLSPGEPGPPVAGHRRAAAAPWTWVQTSEGVRGPLEPQDSPPPNARPRAARPREEGQRRVRPRARGPSGRRAFQAARGPPTTEQMGPWRPAASAETGSPRRGGTGLRSRTLRFGS